jgi:hypothetical protein
VAPWVPFTGSLLAKRCQLDFVRGIVAWPVAKGAARFEKISEISLGFGPRPFPPTSHDFLPALRRQIIARRNVLSAAGLHHGSTFVSTTRGRGRGLAPSLQPDGAALLSIGTHRHGLHC